MRHVIHVISDLHLGGAAATEGAPAFQMCRPDTHVLLARFIDSVPESAANLDSHLIIAGDIVDFLAEEPFQAFTADQDLACSKLQRIFETTAVVWDALQRFAHQRSGFLTLMLGNHDIELSFPRVRQLLLERLSGQRIRFIYDNEAFTLGPLIIEHGNRFDAWNAVPHDSLRRVRSQMSRKRDVAPTFPALPGSQMVIDVINPLKQHYPFIDLLKPETAAALPIAAALGAVDLQKVWSAYGKFKASQAVDYDEEAGEPLRNNYISANVNADAMLWLEAQKIAHGGSPQNVSAVGDLLAKGAQLVTDAVRAARIDAVFEALRKLVELRRLHREAFDVASEVDTYLKPAQISANAGFKVIVYGHTHLPKSVPLVSSDGEHAVYLNTGTWADVMCIPQGIWDSDEKAGKALFKSFATDLGANDIAKWRRTVPTYAFIELEDDVVTAAQLRYADGHEPVTTGSLLQRLAGPGGI